MCACGLSARFAQRELDGFARRGLAHELRLLAVLGVDDLVFAMLMQYVHARLHWLVTLTTSVCSGTGFSGMIFGIGSGFAEDSASARTRANSAIVSPTSTASKRDARSRVRSSTGRGPSASESRIADEQSSSAKTAALGTRYRNRRPAASNG